MDTGTRTLVVGEDTFPFHRLTERVTAFETILGGLGRVDFTTERATLATLPDGGYATVVDYLTDSTLTAEQVNGLQSFVADGGGYVPLHCGGDLTSRHVGEGAIDSRAEPLPELRDLVGGYFLDHPEQSTFDVVVEADVDHPVTDGVTTFSVYDEPYQVAYDDVRVLARMDHPDLDAYPVVWVHRYGDGRVCYLSLGHTDEAFATEGFRTLLWNAVAWTATR